MTVSAVKAQAKGTPAKAAGAQVPKPVPPPAPAPSRRRQVPLTPMRRDAAKSMRKLAAHVQDSHPDMSVHEHLRDAARTLEAGNEEGAQRHLRAAMFALTPQSLMRNGLHTDDSHVAARDAMHGVHRHLLLVKDITDVAARNQEAVRRDSGDGAAVPPPRPDPNAGYGPGANAQKPAIRQPPGDQALNAPAKADGGGSDPSVADPGEPQGKGGRQLAYSWDDLTRVIELVGPKGYVHGWIYEGGPGLPSVASHNAALRKKGVTPPTKAHPALTSKPPGTAGSPARAAGKVAVAGKPAAPAAAPKGILSGPHPADRVTVASNPAAPAKAMSGADLKSADQELARRAALLGKPGQASRAHKAVRAEMQARSAGKAGAPKTAVKAAPARREAPPEPKISAKEKQQLANMWTSSYRYSGISYYAGTDRSKIEEGQKRGREFAGELHRLLATNKPPQQCGPGCQDAHKFLAMVDQHAAVQHKEMQRGLDLPAADAKRLFQPGKALDMPAASWTTSPDISKSYAGSEASPGKTRIILHTAPPAKGLDLQGIASGAMTEAESEVVTGGRYGVESVKTTGGVMHVYLTQKDFSAH